MVACMCVCVLFFVSTVPFRTTVVSQYSLESRAFLLGTMVDTSVESLYFQLSQQPSALGEPRLLHVSRQLGQHFSLTGGAEARPCAMFGPGAVPPHLRCTLESWWSRQATASPQNSASSAVGFRPGTLHLLASTPCLITSQHPTFLKDRAGWHWSRQRVVSLLLGVLNALWWNWPHRRLGCKGHRGMKWPACPLCPGPSVGTLSPYGSHSAMLTPSRGVPDPCFPATVCQ